MATQAVAAATTGSQVAGILVPLVAQKHRAHAVPSNAPEGLQPQSAARTHTGRPPRTWTTAVSCAACALVASVAARRHIHRASAAFAGKRPRCSLQKGAPQRKSAPLTCRKLRTGQNQESEPWCRHLTQQDRISCVCIVGGTHGDERNAVYLGRNFAQRQGPAGDERHGYDFELMVIESNLEAVKNNVRYTELDLNRCFLSADLNDQAQTKLYEHRRAKELNEILGPKTSPTPKCDYVLDLHNTTAATGVTLTTERQKAFL
eukprot:TRINITY_DN48668_c0_g1_i2.p1 TRINITY_DN48668_c0_g1~~TRINITY_DN48668_c0_g1_i2.p1  ORF type:complete len:271 (+),score=37.98 TRINITY_DN48668_c0_g1_i2:31-813(+)